MQPRVFCGSAPNAGFSFSAKLKDTCSFDCVPKLTVLRCFRFYLEGQAESLLPTLLTGSLMTVDFRRSGLLRTHEDMITFWLRKFATDEIIVEAYGDVFTFRKRSAMTEKTKFRML